MMSVNDYRKCAKCGLTRAEDMTVTYHRFPNPGTTNFKRAHLWAKYCWPNEDWTSVDLLRSLHTKNKVLCGRHFNSNDFYDNQRQKLSKFAVPESALIEELPSEKEIHQKVNNLPSSVKMEAVVCCEACLVTDVTMFTLNEKFTKVFKDLLQAATYPTTPIPLDGRQKYFCFQCIYLLRKYEHFRQKCRQANDILLSMAASNLQVTKEAIQGINRKQHGLESNLIITSPITNITCIESANELTDFDVSDIKSDTDEVQIQENEEANESIEVEKCFILEPKIDEHVIETYDHEDSCYKIVKNKRVEDVIDTYDHDNSCDEIVKNNRDEQKKVNRKRRVEKQIMTRAKKKKDDKVLEIKEEEEDTDAKKENKEFKLKNKKKLGMEDRVLRYFKDYATVEILSSEDSQKEMDLRKESSNYKDNIYKCDLCFRGYEMKATFENHMKKHDVEAGELVCEYCQLRFQKQKSLRLHVNNTHKRKYNCKLCPYMCFNSDQARRHINLHKGRKYPCEQCGKIFNLPNTLLSHRRREHRKGAACAACGEAFNSSRGLDAHMLLQHRSDKYEFNGPKCQECNIQFATELAWKRHLVLSSKHAVSNGCKCCGEAFPDTRSLKRHSRMHLPGLPIVSGVSDLSGVSGNHASAQSALCPRAIFEVPGTCILCDKWLNNRKEYTTHVTSDHPQSELAKKIEARKKMQCVCEVCGETFSAGCLATHQRRHTGERPYRCRLCGKAYASPTALHMHRRAHHAAPAAASASASASASARHVFDCARCGKSYMSPSALKKHAKTHLGIKPHKCPVCDKTFLEGSEMNIHVRYVHLKEPRPKRTRNKRK